MCSGAGGARSAQPQTPARACPTNSRQQVSAHPVLVLFQRGCFAVGCHPWRRPAGRRRRHPCRQAGAGKDAGGPRPVLQSRSLDGALGVHVEGKGARRMRVAHSGTGCAQRPPQTAALSRTTARPSLYLERLRGQRPACRYRTGGVAICSGMLAASPSLYGVSGDGGGNWRWIHIPAVALTPTRCSAQGGGRCAPPQCRPPASGWKNLHLYPSPGTIPTGDKKGGNR